MKPVLLIIITAMLFISMEAISQRSVISAEVEGDIVTLWEEQANRNCGALYLMEIDQNQEHLVWYQVDTGDAAFCYCNFDLSVTYGPLEPGEYLVDVYYTESYSGDPIYSGSTTFTITDKGLKYASGIISQYQSPCYPIGIEDNQWMDEDDILVYPNPAGREEPIRITIPSGVNEAILEIFSMDGQQVVTKIVNRNGTVQNLILNDEISLVSGIYLMRIVTKDCVGVKRIIIN
jgi:hypothetical protein